MTFLLLLPAILSFWLLGVHYFRGGHYLLVVMCLIMPGLLLLRHRFVLRALQALLVLAFAEWVCTAFDLIQERMARHEPFLRLALIIGGVGAFCLLAALLFQARRIKARYPVGGPAAPPDG